MARLYMHLIPGRTARGLLALVALAAVTTAGTADAAPVNFANFMTTGGMPLTWTDNGTDASLSTGAGADVSFEFVNVVPPGFAGPIDATLNVIAGTTTTPGQLIGGVLVSQPLIPSFTIEFRRDSDNLLLLGVNFTGLLLGQLGSSTAFLSADEGLGQVVTFTSDVLLFPAISTDSLSIALGLNTPLALTGSFVDSFLAAANGGFFSDPPPFVPEPTSVVLVGLGLVAAPIAMRRRRLALANAAE